ncbi:MAG: GTP-binding protein [Candidatus Hodarchaeales archaeon]|jgi:small GTP-binding protein
MVNYSAKIVMLGQGTVGKTSLIRRYVQHTFTHDYITTIGSNFLIKKINLEEGKNMTMTMQLWDLSGQDIFRNIRSRYYLHSRGAIMVFDLTRPSTLKELEKWHMDFTKRVGNVPLMLFGNKCDLRDQIEIRNEDGEMMARKFGATYFETSALDGTGVEPGFFDLAKKIVTHLTAKRKASKLL